MELAHKASDAELDRRSLEILQKAHRDGVKLAVETVEKITSKIKHSGCFYNPDQKRIIVASVHFTSTEANEIIAAFNAAPGDWRIITPDEDEEVKSFIMELQFFSEPTEPITTKA